MSQPDQKPLISETSDGASTPLRSLEISCMLGWTIAADLFVFRAEGYAAVAVFFLIATTLMLILLRYRFVPDQNATNLTHRKTVPMALSVLMVCVAARLAWLGSGIAILSSVIVLVALAMACSGRVPEVLEGIWITMLSPVMGLHRLGSTVSQTTAPKSTRAFQWLAWIIPILVATSFAFVFIFANPDLVGSLSGWATRVSQHILTFIQELSPWEAPFCVAAFFIGAGLLRPLSQHVLAIWPASSTSTDEQTAPADPKFSQLWTTASRNTLCALIAVFCVYLPFEFITLWRKEFPPGFYYAGYAHQGAAWLTFALLLATLVLSIIFNTRMMGTTRQDDKPAGFTNLRRLAWIWSGLNGLLAIAVYNRLLIYVGYNGMTRMRTVGFFGITLVVIGFGLVVWKILHQKRFFWLIHAQLAAFASMVIAYGLFPVDYVAHSYNVRRIVNGDVRPAVMIAVKDINDEGYLSLLDLVDAEDTVVRDGVRALLAKKKAQLTSSPDSTSHSWHQIQFATQRLRRRLSDVSSSWMEEMQDNVLQQRALQLFREHTQPWY